MVSRNWWRGFAVCLLLTICFPGLATAQGSQRYRDASGLYATYKHNQQQIDALNRSIAGHQAAIRAIGRDVGDVAFGFGGGAVARQAAPEVTFHVEAIERDRRALALLERRQAIIERSWGRNNLDTYYGSLGDTSRRTIYDPRTKRDVNLMDFRLDSFRNPGGHRTPSHSKSPPSRVHDGDRGPGRISDRGPSRTSDRGPGRTSDRGPGRTSKSSTHSKSSSTPSRTTSSSKKSSSGGSHSITLTPVN